MLLATSATTVAIRLPWLPDLRLPLPEHIQCILTLSMLLMQARSPRTTPPCPRPQSPPMTSPHSLLCGSRTAKVCFHPPLPPSGPPPGTSVCHCARLLHPLGGKLLRGERGYSCGKSFRSYISWWITWTAKLRVVHERKCKHCLEIFADLEPEMWMFALLQ